MKILICGDIDSRFNLLCDVMKQNSSVDIVFCLGNLGLYTSKSPIKKLLREKLRGNVSESIEFNNKNFFFPKGIYSLIGSLDDPFIGSDETDLINLFRVWNGVQNFSVCNPEKTKYVSVPFGMLSGYYSPKEFPYANKYRSKMKRERKSNLLCKSDFDTLRRTGFNYLFSHESPYGLPEPELGCKEINNIPSITNGKCRIIFTGHHRKYFDKELFVNRTGSDSMIRSMRSVRVVGLPPITDGYVIFDAFNESVQFEKTNIINEGSDCIEPTSI